MTVVTRCLGCARKVPLGARKGRCTACVRSLDAARNAITPSLRRLVLSRADGMCEIQRPGCTRMATTVDHILPLSKGGTADLGNLRAACGHCNFGRGNRD